MGVEDKDYFGYIRKEIKETDGLVDETRGELGEWFDGCEYLQVLGQVYGLTEPYLKIENVRFNDLPKGQQVMIRPGVQGVVSEFKTYRAGRGESAELVLEDVDGGKTLIGQREYQCFRDEKNKFYMVHISSVPAIYERQRQGMDKLFPELVGKQMERVKDVEMIVPEEMRVISQVRNSIFELFSETRDSLSWDYPHFYSEDKDVDMFLSDVINVTSDKNTILLDKLRLRDRVLYSRNMLKIDLASDKYGKQLLRKYFFSSDNELVSKSNARQQFRHFARIFRQGRLELLSQSDVQDLGGRSIQELFGIGNGSNQGSKSALLLERMFPGEFAEFGEIDLEIRSLTMSQRYQIVKNLFNYNPRKQGVVWPDEDFDRVVNRSRENAKLAIKKLIDQKKVEEDFNFYPILLTHGDISKFISWTTLYKLFDCSIESTPELLRKILCESDLEIGSDSFVNFYLGLSNKSSRCKISKRISDIFLFDDMETDLSPARNEFLRDQMLRFSKGVIRRYVDSSKKFGMLEELDSKTFCKVAGTLIPGIYSYKSGNLVTTMRRLFLDEYGVMTREKWNRYSFFSGDQKAKLSKIFYPSREKIRRLFLGEGLDIMETVKENVRVGLSFLAEDLDLPLFALPSSKIKYTLPISVYEVFDLKSAEANDLLKASFGPSYRKLDENRARDYLLALSEDKTVDLSHRFFSLSGLDQSENPDQLKISRENARVVLREQARMAGKTLEQFSSDFIPDFKTYCKLFLTGLDSNRVLLMLRMFPEDYGFLNEVKLKQESGLDDRDYCYRLYFSSRSLMKESAKLPIQSEIDLWNERVRRNCLIYELFWHYRNRSIIVNGSLSRQIKFNERPVGLYVYKPECRAGGISSAYVNMIRNYDFDDSDDYRQFFWRNIVKFCGNPREFFDLEEHGVGRFDECLEVLPEKWLEIGEKILSEIKAGKSGDKVAKEAEPLQVEFVQALGGALRRDKLGDSVSNGWSLMFGAISHPSLQVSASALGFSLEGSRRFSDREKDQLKDVLRRERFDVRNAEAGLEEQSPEVQYAWEDLQDEINFDLRALLMTIFGENDPRLQEDYSLMSWREQREQLIGYAVGYLKGQNSFEWIENVARLFETGIQSVQSHAAEAIVRNLGLIRADPERMGVLQILPELLRNSDNELHKAGLEIVKVFASSMDTQAGILELRRIIQDAMKESVPD